MAFELKKEQYYTFEEYLEIDDGNKYELKDGILYMMSAPSPIHQDISTELIFQLKLFLRDRACKVTHEINVRLFKDEDTSVIPDILVICDNSKMTDSGYIGAPDFIIEIASPSNPDKDYLEKLIDYRDAGVKEYWIISPEKKKILTYTLKENKYELAVYTFNDLIEVGTLSGCQLDLTMFK